MSHVRYPLEYAPELKPGEWDVDEMMEDARAAGWVVSRNMIKRWVKLGLLPPPRNPPSPANAADG